MPSVDPVLALIVEDPGPGEGDTLIYSFISNPGVLVGVLGKPNARDDSEVDGVSPELLLRVGDANGSARLRPYEGTLGIEGDGRGGSSCELDDTDGAAIRGRLNDCTPGSRIGVGGVTVGSLGIPIDCIVNDDTVEP